MAFDRKRPFGEIHPQLNHARFEQDGKYYTFHGVLCDAEGFVIEPEPAPIPQGTADNGKSSDPGTGATAPVLPPGGTATPAPADEVLPPNEPEQQPDQASTNGAEDAPLDIAGWAKRTMNYQWFAVKKAIKEKYGNEFTTAEEARAFVMNLPENQ